MAKIIINIKEDKDVKGKATAERRIDRLQKEAKEGKNLSPAFDTAEDAIHFLRSK